MPQPLFPSAIEPHITHGRKALKWFIWILGTLLLAIAPTPASANQSIHILYINSYHAGYKWSDDIEAGLREKLCGAGIDFTLHIEFMDTKRPVTETTMDLFRQTLKAKYSHIDLRLILTSDDNAFTFIKKHRETLFGDIPVVFCGVNYIAPSALEGFTNVTGINESADIKGTLEMILALHERVHTILVINDSTPTGARMDRELLWIRQHFSDRLAFVDLGELPMGRIINRVSNATQNEAVLYILMLKDSQDTPFEYSESLRTIANASHAPVYGLWDFFLGYGLAGGSLLTGTQQGLEAGEQVLKIIRGEKADTLRIIMETRPTPMVDFDVMKRFRVPMNRLPPGTVVINRPNTFWGSYKIWIAGFSATGLLLFAFTLTMAVLFLRKKRLSKELGRAQEQLQIVLNGTGSGLWLMDVPSGLITLSRGWATHLGYKHQEVTLATAHLQEQILPQDRGPMHQALDDLIAARTKQHRSEYRIKKIDGTVIWVQERGRVTSWGPDGKATRIEGTFVNILPMKTLEQEKQRLQDCLVSTADAMSAVVVTVDMDMNITLWNKQAASTTGLPGEAAIGAPIGQVLPLMANHLDLVAMAIKTGKMQTSHRIQSRRNASVRHKDITVFPIKSKTTRGAIVRIDDMTEHIRMEEAMHHTKTLMSVGGLAAGIAHEINNPISGIVQNTALLLARLTEKSPENIDAAIKTGITMDAIHDYLDMRKAGPLIEAINGSGKRAAEMVRKSLSYAKRNDIRMAPYQITRLLDKTLLILEKDFIAGGQEAFKNIQIIRHFEKDLPDIMCEGPKIQQVLYNILSNAAESLLKSESQAQLQTLTLTIQTESHMLRIDIEDNGPGIQTGLCERIFEPFFTTHNREKGRGLGLFIAHFIITTGHNGQINVDSSPNLFTRFTLRLPLESAPSDTTPDGPHPPFFS